jgi:hypothetical protein
MFHSFLDALYFFSLVSLSTTTGCLIRFAIKRTHCVVTLDPHEKLDFPVEISWVFQV